MIDIFKYFLYYLTPTFKLHKFKIIFSVFGRSFVTRERGGREGGREKGEGEGGEGGRSKERERGRGREGGSRVGKVFGAKCLGDISGDMWKGADGTGVSQFRRGVEALH